MVVSLRNYLDFFSFFVFHLACLNAFDDTGHLDVVMALFRELLINLLHTPTDETAVACYHADDQEGNDARNDGNIPPKGLPAKLDILSHELADALTSHAMP